MLTRPLPVLIWRLFAMAAVVASLVWSPHPMARAQEPAADWEQAGVLDPIGQLVVSGSAIFAVTRGDKTRPDSILRSEDGGARWEMLAPPVRQINDFAVDPDNPRRLFVAGAGAVYRSADGGATWSTALTAPQRQEAQRVVVSPADSKVVFAATAALSSGATWRSVDGGTTWQQLRDLQGSLCGWVFPLIAPDPAVRERVYLSYYCAAGRNFSAQLLASDDLWSTDGMTILPYAAGGPLGLLFPQFVAFDPSGMRGVVAAQRDARAGGSAILQTDDGGASWRTLAGFSAGREYLPNVRLGGFHAERPSLDRLFVGLQQDGRGVLGSIDGGMTWGPIGSRPIGAVHALVYDASADRLYAGTESGLWSIVAPVPQIDLAGGPVAAPFQASIRRVAGGGPAEDPAGVGPLDLKLVQPHAVAVESDGSLLVADQRRLIRARPDGSVEDVRPTVRPSVGFIATSPDGRIVFTEDPTSLSSFAGVHAITPDGRLVQLAGRASPGTPPGDPSSAIGMQLLRPAGVAVDSAGTLYVADSGNHVVRRLDPNGTIQTVAGTGRPGWSGDGLPTTETDLDEPWALAFDGQGRLLVADRAGQRVVRLESDGTLTTVAGTGLPGYGGDGGPATAARLAFPSAIAVDGAGRIAVADTMNHAVRVVDVDGTIWTLAGTGSPGEAGDGLAAGVPLASPVALAVDGAGGLYVAEFGNNRVVRIGPGE